MKRFALVLTLAFAGILATPTQADPSGIPDEAILRSQLAAITAPIRSEADLQAHLATRLGKDSPLDALSPKARSAFVESLSFSGIGLGSLRHDVLEGLTVFDAYKILALFGWQDYATEAPGLRVVDDIDRMIRAGAMQPKDECNMPDGGSDDEGTAGNPEGTGAKSCSIKPWCRMNHSRCTGTWPNRVCTYNRWYTCDSCSCHS